MIWDWKDQPEFEIEKNFIKAAYKHAKDNFPKNLPKKFLPRADVLVENFVSDYTKNLGLKEPFIIIKSEVAELQKFLNDLGIKQPVVFEMCRIKVK